MSFTHSIKIWDTTTKVFRHLQQLTKPEVIIAQGGTSSSKTVSILQHLGTKAFTEPGSIISVVGQDLPNLKKGALRDFKTLIATNSAFKHFIANPKAKEGPYEFTNGSLIEFAAFDDAQDAKAGKRDYCFLNEANGIPYEIYFELEQRTKKQTFIDFNPTSAFWVHTEVIPEDRAYGFISTFMDNEFCPEKIASQVKGYFVKWKQTKQAYWENKWKVYGLGQTGIVEGVVFPDWEVVVKFPELSELSNFGYAIDFGFAKDPLAISKCGIKKHSGKFVGQELFYESGVNAYSLDTLMPQLGITKADPIIADSANMDAIDYLQKKGWNISPADKPPGSIKQGIELLQQAGIEIVQGSKNWIMELGSYVYKTKTGIFDKNTPVDRDNHLIDGSRYYVRAALLNKGVNPKKARKNERQAFVI